MAFVMLEFTMRGTVPRSNGGDETVSNVFHLFSNTVFPLPTASSLTTSFNSAIQNVVAAALSDTYTGIETLVRNLMSPLNPVEIGAAGANGAISGDRLPLMTAGVLRMKTLDRGKRFRGSKHFAPISEDDTLLDELTVTALGRFTAIGNAIFSAFNDTNGNGWASCVLSRTYSNLTSMTPTFVYSPMNGFVVNKTVGTMRRRKERTSV